MAILNRVELSPNGVTAIDEFEKREPVTDIKLFLGATVKIVDGFTLLHLIEYLERNLDFYENIISVDAGGHPLQPFIDEAKKPAPAKSNLKAINIGWHACVFDKKLEMYPYVNVYISKRRVYAADFIPLNEVSRLPIILNEKFEVYTFAKPGVLFKSKKEFTLLDIIKALFNEFSFYGTPKQRDKTAEDLKQRLDDIKNNPEKCISMKDLKKKLH